ncbi:MAG: hypothetical protein ACR2HG_07950 [Pyrinomonadaceae bacterium]
MPKRNFLWQTSIILLFTFVLFSSGCVSIVKTKDARPTLLKTEDATEAQLLEQISHFAKVNSMHAKMDLKFEDNSFAEQGIAEKYKTADGEVVVQRPADILLKVQIPIIKTDVAQMSSDGEKFRVAILEDGGSGKYKKFVSGTNNADYTALQERVNKMDLDDGKTLKQNVNAFANLRPQHFTDAMLMRPVDNEKYSYLQSTILQEEEDSTQPKKSPLRRVLRGYYLLEEFRKNTDGSLAISRRFWFDRVGKVRLAKQQIFDEQGEIESDIIYGKEGNLTATGEYNNLPLRIEVTRPKEKYKMSLTYQSPENVTIGKTYNAGVFVLENRWNLEEVDLDKKLREIKNGKSPVGNQTSQTGKK